MVNKALVFGTFTAVHRFAIFNIGYQWWAWAILFFAEDLTYYWFHRTSHECRLFWASHVVHHSSQHYNLGTALRQTWTGGLMSFIFWLWLPLIGFPPIMVLTMQAISLLYQFWIHTELVRRLGPLEWVMNTPSHHRVHHGSNQRYLDRNHAGMLIIWDRLFGSFEPEGEKVIYGLTKNINSYNPLRIAFHEWIDIWNDVRTAPTWRLKLRYLRATGMEGREPQQNSCQRSGECRNLFHPLLRLLSMVVIPTQSGSRAPTRQLQTWRRARLSPLGTAA